MMIFVAAVLLLLSVSCLPTINAAKLFTATGSASSKLKTDKCIKSSGYKLAADSTSCEEATKFELLLSQKPWIKLSAEEQTAFEALGYTAEIWNDFERPAAVQLPWKELPNETIKKLEAMNYTERIWQCDDSDEVKYSAAIKVPSFQSLVNPELLPVGRRITLLDDEDTVSIGVFTGISSVLYSAVMARLLTGAYGLNVEMVAMKGKDPCEELVSGRVDLIVDVLDSACTRGARQDENAYDDDITGNDAGANESKSKDKDNDSKGRLYTFGHASESAILALRTTIPKNKDMPYFDSMSTLVPHYTSLYDTGVLSNFPQKKCTMGPWSSDTDGFGVWCLKRGTIAVIWAEGPMTPAVYSQGFRAVTDYMAFINGMGLPIGIEFLQYDDFMHRVTTVVAAGFPALFFLRDPSPQHSELVKDTQQIDLPYHPSCGSYGEWTAIGNWSCTPRMRPLVKTGGKKIRSNPLLKDAIEFFRLNEAHVTELYNVYEDEKAGASDASRFKAAKASLLVKHKELNAARSAADKWVSAHTAIWSKWFTFLPPPSTSGKLPILLTLGALLVGFAVVDPFQLRRPVELPDTVDRSIPRKVINESLAGIISTLSIVMDSVAVASVLMALDSLSGFTEIAMKHVLVGHFVGQLLTLLCSHYETPITTPSLELLPFATIILDNVQEATVGRSAEYALATMLFCMMLVSILSGFTLYLIGLLRVGYLLKYIPYSVQCGIQAGMGIILLAVGMDLACDYYFLELESFSELKEMLAWSGSGAARLWLPALGAGLLLFLIDNFIYESPYTIVIFMCGSIAVFHVLRVYVFKTSIADAQEGGWVFDDVESGEMWSLWKALRLEFVCWDAVINSLGTIFCGAFCGPLMNNLCDLAVVKSILPPAEMGSSDFNSELTVQGRAHIMTGLVGGFPTDYGNDDTIVHRKYGGQSRLSMYVHVLTMFLVIVWPLGLTVLPQGTPDISAMLPYIPKSVNGAVICLAGFEFLYGSLVESWSSMATSEYAVVVVFVVTVLATQGDLLTGILVGMFFGFFDFIVRYANIVTVIFPKRASATLWPPRDAFKLEFCGLRKNVVVAELSGFLFFASAPEIVDELLEKLKELSGSEMPHKKVLIVNWTAVTGIDAGASAEFARLTDAGDTSTNKLLIFCGMQPPVEQALRNHEVLPEPDTDGAGSENNDGSDSSESDDGADIVVSSGLESALYRAELMMLRRTDSPEAGSFLVSAEKGNVDLGVPYTSLEKLRALGSGLSRKGCEQTTNLAKTLRALVSRNVDGQTAKLVSFYSNDVIIQPKERLDSVFVLLHGCVAAIGDDETVRLRHVSALDIIGDEVFTPTGRCWRFKYCAAPRCILLKLNLASLESSEKAALFETLVLQFGALKSFLDRS
eukprot:TRINITY_DN3232_c1_g1_i1.p1 TRINITY_DN3232_c1_g1~~TRINITY_DN3232_c1_g1_i1.p1  ORF type:complete len:1379 (-),score=128.76 TRINITY_DN3232_c1_g1_i1:306-4442(-)